MDTICDVSRHFPKATPVRGGLANICWNKLSKHLSKRTLSSLCPAMAVGPGARDRGQPSLFHLIEQIQLANLMLKTLIFQSCLLVLLCSTRLHKELS